MITTLAEQIKTKNPPQKKTYGILNGITSQRFELEG